MGLFDRIVLTIFTFSLAFISFMFILLPFGWYVPLTVLQRSLMNANGRWTVGLIGALFFIVSLRFIYFGFSRRYPLKTVVHETNLGEVRVSLYAIESLVKRVSRQVRGVREVKAWINTMNDGIGVQMRVWVTPDSNIPKVSAEIQNSVKTYVHDVVGAEVRDIHIFVENITTESRRSRVD